ENGSAEEYDLEGNFHVGVADEQTDGQHGNSGEEQEAGARFRKQGTGEQGGSGEEDKGVEHGERGNGVMAEDEADGSNHGSVEDAGDAGGVASEIKGVVA